MSTVTTFVQRIPETLSIAWNAITTGVSTALARARDNAIAMMQRLHHGKRDYELTNNAAMIQAEFLRVADDYRNGACKALSGHDWLHLDDLEVIDEILDGVIDRKSVV